MNNRIRKKHNKNNCEYCHKSKSLFYDKDSKDVREVYVELDASLTIASNHFDMDEEEKSISIGFTPREAMLMAQYSYNIKINNCPMCGRKLVDKP